MKTKKQLQKAKDSFMEKLAKMKIGSTNSFKTNKSNMHAHSGMECLHLL